MNKKLFLGMGTIASVVAPIVAVVSCGDEDTTTHTGNSTKGSEATNTNVWNAPVTEEVTAQGHTFTISNELQTGRIYYASNKMEAIRLLVLETKAIAPNFVKDEFTEPDANHQSPEVFTILNVEKRYKELAELFKTLTTDEKENYMNQLDILYFSIKDLNARLKDEAKAKGIN